MAKFTSWALVRPLGGLKGSKRGNFWRMEMSTGHAWGVTICHCCLKLEDTMRLRAMFREEWS